ncbi:MAG: winged helix-turn-helix transcriptional regulator [Candidatus Hodarchaeales archaeon]|jgi:DNA-binding HxlR family transcriptional regulator
MTLNVESDRDVLEDCSILLGLKILGKKWMVFVLSELLTNDDIYFTDLQSSVQDKYGKGISGRVLSDCLSTLEGSGIIIRIVNPETIPARVSYSLTPKGQDLKVVLGVLKGWGVKWGGNKQKICQAFTCLHNAVGMIDIDKTAENCPWIEKEV